MPRYCFFCDACNKESEIFQSLKDGPPIEVICEQCGNKMRRDFSCQFILKGDGWPGKEVKNKGVCQKIDETFDRINAERESTQKEMSEVLQERKKGKKSFQEYTKHNRAKVERYRKNIRKGIKGG